MYILRGKNIYLAALTRENCYTIFENLEEETEPLVEEINIGWAPEKADEWFEQIQEHMNAEHYHLGIFSNEDDRLLGNIQIVSSDLRHGQAELGFGLLHAQERNRGYGNEAVWLMTKFIFENMRMHRVYAKVAYHNLPCQRCLDKVGYVMEGRERESVFFDGKYHDLLVYSILEKEFQEEKNRREHPDEEDIGSF